MNNPMELITLYQAIFLGIVEGLTEFIPVSSTGHLILLVDLLGFQGPQGRVFEIVIQFGAIMAVCWVYKERLWHIARHLFHDKQDQHFISNIFLAFIPAAILGVIFHHSIKSLLFNPLIVSITLILGGGIIILIEKTARVPSIISVETMPRKTALAIGFAQSLAMIPGVSRSGATIMGAMLLGVERKAATEFSFLLAIPTMLGATAYDILQNYHHLTLENIEIIGTGFISAFLAALLVVRSAIALIGRYGFLPFAYYRIVLGSVMLWFLLG